MRLFISFLCIFCFSFSSISQDQSNFEHVIDSKAFGKERKVYVFLPERYLNSETDSFMVTYILDAQSEQFWNMAKYNINYMVNSYVTLPMIVVGIHTEDRGGEFIPEAKKTNPSDGNDDGIAHLLQQHLKEEVFPLIEKTYRTKKFRAIVGHSRGGAFISHTLFSDHADLFNAYIGISPAMGYIDNQILNDADSILQTGRKIGKYLYCSTGDVGPREDRFGGQVAHLDSLIKKYPNKTLAWEHEVIPGTDHWGCVIPTMNISLMRMSRNFWVDQKVIEDFAANKDKSMQAQIDAFYTDKNENFDYSVTPQIGIINYYGNQLNEDGLYDRAIEVYDWALRIDPINVTVQISKGWTYYVTNEFDKAKMSFDTAMKNLELKKEQMSEKEYDKMKKGILSAIDELEKKRKEND